MRRPMLRAAAARRAGLDPATDRADADAAARANYATARETIHRRAAAACELCGTARGTDAHHRQSRAVGVDCPCNLVLLCSGCHHGRVHGHPRWAREMGWIVSRMARGRHRTEPAYLPGPGGWYVLGCDGTRTPTVEP